MPRRKTTCRDGRLAGIPRATPRTKCSLRTSSTRPSGPSSSSIETSCAMEHRLVASKTEFRRLESVSSGQEHAKVRRIHSEDVAEKVAQFARSLGQNPDPVQESQARNSLKSGKESVISSVRHSHGDCRPCAGCRLARAPPVQRLNEPFFSKSSSGFITPHPGFKDFEMSRDFRGLVASGT